MWSPWASEKNESVKGVWLGLLWRDEMKGGFVLQGGEEWREGTDGEEGYWVDGGSGARVWLMAGNYARLSGREDMDEKRLRVAQNRYLMHKDYSDGVEKKGVVLEEEGEDSSGNSDDVLVWEEKEL